MGGEHDRPARGRPRRRGSSPRGRGTPLWTSGSIARSRFIPAWAGNTLAWCLASGATPVHPRVGGEHRANIDVASPYLGSSPRGRGTLFEFGQCQQGGRFIPAWAGNTRMWTRKASGSAVHPRVGGEHCLFVSLNLLPIGSSPRGRGTPVRLPESTRAGRFIPAWAGNTQPRPVQGFGRPVHPRVGGEHRLTMPQCQPQPGSSPRGRGTQPLRWPVWQASRFIPAWAGNTDHKRGNVEDGAVHPRVGGEHTSGSATGRFKDGSSPRGRGTRQTWSAPRPERRFIPAWAGNTFSSASAMSLAAVHPRVGGEHTPMVGRSVSGCGSSPRGRGTRAEPLGRSWSKRFIPAWAGNTCPEHSYDDDLPVHPRVGGEHER